MSHTGSQYFKTFRRLSGEGLSIDPPPPFPFPSIDSERMRRTQRSRCSILILDREREDGSIATSLHEAGYKVFGVGSAEEAMTLMSKVFVDVIICNQELSSEDGRVLMEQLASLPTLPHGSRIPIVVAAANPNQLSVVSTKFRIDGAIVQLTEAEDLVDELERFAD